MKKVTRLICSFVVFALCFSLFAVSAFASSHVIFENDSEDVIFLPGSEFSESDLFGNFKNLLPGDTLSQTVVVKNHNRGYGEIKVYMRAVPHDAENPLSEAVSSKETLESMNDFLSKLTLTVRNGADVIFNGSPDKTGGLTESVELGVLAFNEVVKLRVELSMPADLGNEYANRIGEIDWIFTVSDHYDPIIIPIVPRETITAIKLLDGAAPDTDEFVFQLTDAQGNVLQTVNNRGVEVIFNSIQYTQPGVYTYYLREVPGSNPDLIYDGTVYTVNVNVHYVNGFLNSEIEYLKDGVPYVGVPVFSNTTDEEDSADPVSVSVWATKTLNRHLAIEDSFTFELYDGEGKLLQSSQSVGGYVFFDRLYFEEAGRYVYTIKEVRGNVPDMIYDSAEYKVIIDVVENGGKLYATVSYEKNGLAYYDTPNFANRTTVDPEIPDTGDSQIGALVLCGGIGVLAAVTVLVLMRRNSKGSV